MPPLYQFTGVQYFKFFAPAKALEFLGSVYRRKYQELPAQLGMVSVSLFAWPLHLGHLTLTQDFMPASGLSPVSVGLYLATLGRSTGRFFSGTGTQPCPRRRAHCSQ